MTLDSLVKYLAEAATLCLSVVSLTLAQIEAIDFSVVNQIEKFGVTGIVILIAYMIFKRWEKAESDKKTLQEQQVAQLLEQLREARDDANDWKEKFLELSNKLADKI